MEEDNSERLFLKLQERHCCLCRVTRQPGTVDGPQGGEPARLGLPVTLRDWATQCCFLELTAMFLRAGSLPC